VLGDGAIPAQALGDAALLGKVTLVQPTSGNFGGFALALAERVRLAAARLPQLGLPAAPCAAYAAEAAALAAWLDDHPACASWAEARDGWLAVHDASERRAALGVLTGLLPWTR
jgi:hypothetical protein